ncbi:GATS protein-like 3 [Mortierella alpina]|uniref:GATS protein-like 3 n=1 Tax=Mortierella alpina TaxID=64518 RepID=A0A9P6J9S3_MORAP|nr:GATS protein-like 3 [Mortierella alpina]
MIVDILPFRLKLASIEKSAIPRCTHQLMKLVLFPAGPQHFFSYTETDKEVSLILDESHIPGFPEETLNVCNVIWRAVQIEPGESGLGAVEVVSQVSKPLADINVSIMQISTYDADFTLLPECDLTRALECLSKTFSITNNPLEDIGIQPEELQTWDTTFPMSPTEIHSLQDALSLASATTRGRQSSLMSLLEGEEQDCISPKDRHANGREDSGIGSEETSEPGSGNLSGHGSHVLGAALQGLDPALISSLTLDADASKARHHPFQVDFPHRLHITSMEHGLVGQLAIRLLESIFFDNRQTDTTLSIIMDDATMSLFPDHTLNTQAGNWRLIAIGDGPLGFDECGIVSEFSRPLSENGIGLFYLSTFNSDYIMVNDQDFEQAVACLKETAQTVDWKRPLSTSSPRLLQQDAKSIRSIDTSSLSGASSDVDAAELSPVSTTADASETKADELEGVEEAEEAALPLEEGVPA